MNNKGITISMIFEASSANYGEGLGNISTLKKMTRGDGNIYTYISRQALRYSIIKNLNWDSTPVTPHKKDSDVVQFDPLAEINEYPEIDLFGYMKTTKGSLSAIRSAVVRLSNAISLEPYNSDLDFLTNVGLAQRHPDSKGNNLAQSEIHKSFYAYTITVDLERVGVDPKSDINLDSKEKADRLVKFLDAIQFLNRDIKGRNENLNPVFAIGGLYDRKNPYFDGRLKMNKGKLDVELVKSVISSCDDTKNNTKIGYLTGMFANDNDIAPLNPVNIGEFFVMLKKEAADYYA